MNPSTPKTRRVLFNTQFAWPFSPVDLSLAAGLRARGHEVAMVACGGLPAYCEQQTDSLERPPCAACLANVTTQFDSLHLDHFVLKDWYTAADVTEADRLSTETPLDKLLKLEFKGVAVGELARLNLFQYFHGAPLDIPPEKEKVFRRCLHSALLVTEAADRILEHFRPDLIVTVNGKFLQWAPFVHLARQKSIEFATWEDICLVPSGTIFALNDIAHEQRIDSVWPELSRQPLTEPQRQRVLEHFKLWKEGKNTPWPIYDQTSEWNPDKARELLGLRSGAPVVSLFPNVSWDSTSVGLEGAFESMFEWVFQAVDYAGRNPSIELVVRAHPAETKIPDQFKSSTPICAEVRRRFPNLPANVKLVDSDSPISSYALAAASDVTMVYASTFGLELALQGVRPWVASRVYYAGKGFTLDLESAQDMFSRLDARPFESRLTPDQIALAERLAHITRFQRIFPFPNLGKGGRFDAMGPADFAPGVNAVLDRLCNYLQWGEPFLDIGNPPAATLETSPTLLSAVAKNTESNLQVFESVVVDDQLAGLRQRALQKRFGNWRVQFRGLTIHCHDLLSFYIAAKDIFLQRIYDFEAATSAPMIIDGGGHIGLFTLFAKQKYPHARVTVFEPDAESRGLLELNLKSNGWSDVRVVPAGLYGEKAELSFACDHSDGSSLFVGEKTGKVKVVTLSDYITSEVDLLKLNIEGAELAVLTELGDQLARVKELVLEYHGFPELGQNLHPILALLERAGFRYLIHDFDVETNGASKPPFRLQADTRFFLLVYAKRLFPARKEPSSGSDDLSRTQPLSRTFGFDRGTPIDRYYIGKFLESNRARIRGRVLEIGDNTYTKQYGQGVTQSDVLNAVPAPGVTLVGDFATGTNIPAAAFDCIIFTQTLQVIYDCKSVLRHALTALKPGGTLLLSASGISQISRYDMDRWGEFWRFTDKSLRSLLDEAAPGADLDVQPWGNVAVAKAFLDGRAWEELPRETLEARDPDYQVVLTASLRKPGALIIPLGQNGNARTAAQTEPAVLIYHRVVDDPVDAHLLAVSPANFEQQLQVLSEQYRVIPLSEMLAEAASGSVAPGTVALTFDDGYYDVLTNAVPLLEKYGLHATVFVTSGMVGAEKEFWWDELAGLFFEGPDLPQALPIDGQQFPTATPAQRRQTHDQLWAALKSLPSENIQAVLEAFHQWARTPRRIRRAHRVVTVDELRQLARSPSIEIGAHTVSHPQLSALSVAAQRLEISESKSALEQWLGRPVPLFSYPFGGVDDFTKATESVVADLGFAAGIANVQGPVVAPLNPWAVPRWLVRDWAGAEFAAWLGETNKQALEQTTFQHRVERLERTSLYAA